MRYRSPYTLFKKTLRSGNKMWYYYFYDEKNVRHQYSTGCKTKAQAEMVCLELYRSGSMIPTVQNPLSLLSIRSAGLASVQDVEQKKNKAPLFREFLKNWFDYGKCEYVQNRLQFGYNITKSYADAQRRVTEVYILPFWGKHRIDEVSETLCNKWIAQMKKRGLGNATINNILKCFKVILSFAFKKDITKANLAKKVNMLKNDSKTHGIFTKEEVKMLFAENNFDSVWNCNSMHYTLNLLTSKTGLRIGEVLALRKENLYPDYLVISHSWTIKYGLQDTKTHKSRVVPISEDMYARLSKIAAGQTAGEYIFSAKKGRKPIDRTEIAFYFKKALEAIGIDEGQRNARFLTFHSWRHYANSLLINSGVPKSIVQSIIGHVGDDAMTEHYTHVTLDEARRVLDVV